VMRVTKLLRRGRFRRGHKDENYLPIS